MPKYEDGFVCEFLCEESKIDCWFGQCNDCSGINVAGIHDLVDFALIRSRSEAKWMVWKKKATTNRIEKQEEKASWCI